MIKWTKIKSWVKENCPKRYELVAFTYHTVINWFLKIVSFFSSNQKPIVLALVWLLFILFFTYTILIVEAVKVSGNFYKLFYTSQSEYIALFVNAGIIIMLLFDNHAVNKELQGFRYYIPYLGLILCIALMAHCRSNVDNQLREYKYPISYEKLSFIIYCCFIGIVYILKCHSLWDSTKVRKEPK